MNTATIISLVVGKFLGIFIFSWITVTFGWAPMPNKANWKMMASVAVLGGIGFTVSLFIANLSFGVNPAQVELLSHAKLGILTGSVLAGVLGFIILHFTMPEAAQTDEDDD